MGVVKNFVEKKALKAADKIAKLSSLSPEQVASMQAKREEYLNEMPDPNDFTAQTMTEKLLAASSVEIYNAYLPQIKDLYLPVEQESECNKSFNVRYINITKWVTDKKENSLEKLINVYSVLADEPCNIALVFNRTCETTNVYLGVSNKTNETDNVKVNEYIQRLQDSVRGNFPGAQWKSEVGRGGVPSLMRDVPFSVASVSNIPTEKSEKFISQTIEKLLDGIVPDSISREYSIILLATPIDDVEERKIVLSEFYSSLAPYAGWQTNFTYTESDAMNSMAIFGVNAGVSAGVQNATNQALTTTKGQTDSTGASITNSTGNTVTDSTNTSVTDSSSTTTGSSTTDSVSQSSSHMEGSSESKSKGKQSGESVNAGVNVPFVEAGGGVSSGKSSSSTTGTSLSDTISQGTSKSITQSVSNTIGKSITNSVGRAISSSVGRSVSNSLGRAVSTAVATTEGITKGVNFGGNFGANFARASNVTISVGKNEGITQSFTNYNIKHALSLLDEQMKRYEKSTALGMWDFAAYVLSEDPNVANNVAHSYLSLTQGEESYVSRASINLWRGDISEESSASKVITDYVREFKHPVFAINPNVIDVDESFNCYPTVVTATAGLSGKELAYSLNFPQRSVPGLPIIECAEFGRNIVSYDPSFDQEDKYGIGKIFHMNREDNTDVCISKRSLASHVFVTGSTGSGKSNTIYRILDEASKDNVNFLVVEPAKGEYKNVFPSSEVNVYGTNPTMAPLLVLDPFSFPDGVHVLEHLDRLIEIFNVCWPMYAAMPAVLKNAVEKSYEDCGWDLIKSVNPYGKGLYPSFSDVARNVKTIIDSSEYDNENKGAYKGSLLTRLQSLTNGINGLIFNRKELPVSDLFDSNVIVDISRVGSTETKSLIMGILVLKLQEYRMSSTSEMNSNLRHITVLEEAHNILKRTSTEQPVEGANLLGKSVEMIANAIAEMRTYGEGFIIADQAPGLMDMSVIRNTNTKIIMRLPDYDDRELVGRAANLDEDQVLELAKLPRGVAALYQNEWVQPILCKIRRYDGVGKFSYVQAEPLPKEMFVTERVEIAELLSKGTKVDSVNSLRDIRAKLEKCELDASEQVAIMRLLNNPPKEPKMTKLAPLMKALFPVVRDSIRNEYAVTKDMKLVTESAGSVLDDTYGPGIDSQTRRYIIQGVITYYFLNELNQINLLENWSKMGGLS